jgi:predicted DNA-binding transcriptional regulator AlpA
MPKAPETPVRKILRWRHVQARTSLSRSCVDSLELRGDFPRRIQLSPRIAGWYEDELVAWLDSRRRQGP